MAPVSDMVDLFDKLKSPDADFRYMALTDLSELLKQAAPTAPTASAAAATQRGVLHDGIGSRAQTRWSTAQAPRLDAPTQAAVVQALLRMLDDRNGEVQNMAVKCLPPLLHVVAPLHVATCVEHIARMLTQGERAETRDLAAIALKTIFMDLSPTHADMVGIMAHLARTLAAQLAESSQHVQLDVLDILRDVLLRFGPSFGPRTRPQHHRSAREGVDADVPDAGGDVEALESTLQPSLYALLSDARAAVRKRACLALAALAHLMPPAAFQAFVTLLVSELMAARPATESTRARVATLLQMVAALVRAPATRARLSPWIAQMVPTITALAAGTVKTGGAADNDDDVAVFKKETDHNRRGHDGDDGEDDEDDEDDAQKTDELREAALQCLHALVSAYPHTMAAFTPSILTTAFACLRYDPNYALSDTDDAELNETGDGDAVMHDAQDDRSEAESADDEDDEDDDMMDDDEDDDVDDDDQSWKVRRAAAKLLTVLIEHPSSTLPPSPPAAAGTSPSSPANHMSSADWRRLLAVLMARITEREESVRLDVLTTLSQWIRAVTAMQADLRTAKQEPATDDASMPYRHLLVRTPRLVAALVKQIQLRRGFTFQHARRNVATRQQTFRLLRQLLVATASDPTAFGPAQMTLVLIPISQSLAVLNNARGAAFARSDQTSSVLKIGVLAFIASLIAARPSLAAESADTLAPLVLQAAKDGFYRLAAQAFDVLAQLVRLMAAQAAPPARTVGLIRDCFAYAIRKIQSTDVDLDVKQTAIQCIASICANAVPVPGPAAVLSGHADADLSGTIAAGAAADPGAGRLTRGDYETVAVPTLLQKLAEDDLTRLSALQAVTTIAESPLWHDAPDAPVSLTAQLAPLMQVLCPLLRKNSHPLRLEVLRAVSVLLTSYAAHMGPLVPSLTQELKRYLADPDMVLMPAVLETLATLCRSPTLFPQAEEAFLRDIAPALVQVIFDRTALLGTPQARPPLRHMVEALAAYPASTAFLLDQMLWPIVDVTVPDSALLARAAQAFPIAAELNAILLSHIKSNSAPLTRIYHAFLAHVDGDGPSREPAASATVPAETSVPESAAAVSDASRASLWMSILVLGEVGRRMPLFGVFPDVARLVQRVMAADPAALPKAKNLAEEEVRGAAAVTLGKLALGDPTTLMDTILSGLRSTHVAQQHLMLVALREVVSHLRLLDPAFLAVFPPQLWQVLSALVFETAGRAQALHDAHAAQTASMAPMGKPETLVEDTNLALISQCMGMVVVLNPDTFLADVDQLTASPQPLVRAAMLHTLRFAFTAPAPATPETTPARSESTAPETTAPESSERLSHTLLAALMRLQDDALVVRVAAMTTFQAVLHARPSLVLRHLPTLLPLLYAHVPVREDLVRVVEMGPFKHKVDQGLELRKLAYETLLRLLDPPALHRLDLDRFLVVAQQGLADPANELKVLTHLIIERAAAANAAVTRHHLDAFVPALETTLSMTAKSNAVKQEVERLDELLASTLRLALSLERSLLLTPPPAGAVAGGEISLGGSLSGSMGASLATPSRLERDPFCGLGADEPETEEALDPGVAPAFRAFMESVHHPQYRLAALVATVERDLRLQGRMIVQPAQGRV